MNPPWNISHTRRTAGSLRRTAATLALLTMLAAAGCGKSREARRQADETQKAAILSLYRARLAARDRAVAIQTTTPATNSGGSLTITNFSASAYVAALRAIDVSGCPARFNNAWADYLRAWQTRAAANPALILSADPEFGAGAVANHVPPTPVGEHRDPDTMELWQRCVAVALLYGAEPVY